MRSYIRIDAVVNSRRAHLHSNLGLEFLGQRAENLLFIECLLVAPQVVEPPTHAIDQPATTSSFTHCHFLTAKLFRNYTTDKYVSAGRSQ